MHEEPISVAFDDKFEIAVGLCDRDAWSNEKRPLVGGSNIFLTHDPLGSATR